MARRIDTPAGTLVGRVDRALRKVVWALVCPECSLEIPLDGYSFRGMKAPLCACGWKPIAEGTDEKGRPVYTNFEHAFDAPVSSDGQGIHAGMRL